jgi:hypothetical protein
MFEEAGFEVAEQTAAMASELPRSGDAPAT